MKSKDIVSLSLLFICTTVLAFSLTFYIVTKNFGEKNVSQNVSISSDNTTSVSKYTVGEYKGKIAVYYDDNTSPDEVYDSFLNSLPVEDIERLNIGITVYSKEDLQKLIEDYTS